jgi:hypothetical protein
MRIKGGGARAMVEAPRRTRERRPPDRYYEDGFDVMPARVTPLSRGHAKTLALVRELAAQGRARVEEDERRRERAQLEELGQIMGALTADLVVEVLNHYVQRPAGQRTSAMVVLGALVSALFVEFWAVLKGADALERALASERDSLEQELGYGATQLLEHFISFIEDTEGQPARRLAGTLYACRRES